MDAEGTNVRRLTQGGFNTQPRWSPKGDVIVYTSRQGNHDLWAVSPDGSNPRRLTAGPGSNEGASWAPNGRHLVFQSSRLGGYSALHDARRRIGAAVAHEGARRDHEWSLVTSASVIR